ncbi:MAG: helix-turn-helix transcriptional regulator [Phycisphaerales bacterium]|nr:helix-turn-helix transcriptional regulator [Phycisphaerales bacterium]
MQAYKRRTGEKMTYQILADKTGIAYATLNNMGSNPKYNATLSILTKICTGLETTPDKLLEYLPEDPPEPEPNPKKTKKKKKTTKKRKKKKS